MCFIIPQRKKRAYNKIELSVSSYKQYYSLNGSLYYNNYNLSTGRSGSEYLAASGGVISVNGASDITDEKGEFKTNPFLGAKGTYVRYLAACNGRSAYKEFKLPSSVTTTAVPVSVTDTGGVTTTNTYNTMVLSAGNVTIPVDSNETPIFASVTATNAGVSIENIYINDTSTKMTAKISNDEFLYTNVNGETVAENVTAVDFLVCDGSTNIVKMTIPATKESNGDWLASETFKLNEPTKYTAGDKLFVSNDDRQGFGGSN